MWQHQATYEPTEFELVCQKLELETGVTCEGVEAPLVLITVMPMALDAIGLHPNGEAVVMVVPRHLLPEGITQEMVIFHEIVHYVLEEVGLKESRCQSEDWARKWTAEVKGYKYDPTWKVRYGCASNPWGYM